MYLNISPVPKKYFLSDTFSAPEKPGKYLETPSIYTHFSGAGEVLIYTYLAPERPEKPEKYLYTPLLVLYQLWICLFGSSCLLEQNDDDDDDSFNCSEQ